MKNEEPTRVEAFTADATKRAHLLALLNDPVFREAADIAEEIMEPKVGTQADAVPAIAAAKCHQVAGANEFMRLIRSFTKEFVRPAQPKVRQLAKTLDDIPE